MFRMMMVASAIAFCVVTAAHADEQPVASADGEAGDVHLDVKQLKRGSDGEVMLRFSIANNNEKPFELNSALRADSTPDYHTVDGVYLLDGANKKKYLVVRDSDKHCLCSRNVEDIPPKGTANFWAKFPPLPDNVEKVSVVVPHFTPMDDVPVSK
jgi:hypothetical protein